MSLKPIQADGLASVEVVFRIVCHAVQVIGDAVLGSVLGVLKGFARHGCVESRKRLAATAWAKGRTNGCERGLTRAVVPQVGAVCPQRKFASWRGFDGLVKC